MPKIFNTPPVLTDELIEIWERFDPEKPVPLLDMLQAIAEAQRNADFRNMIKQFAKLLQEHWYKIGDDGWRHLQFSNKDWEALQKAGEK